MVATTCISSAWTIIDETADIDALTLKSLYYDIFTDLRVNSCINSNMYNVGNTMNT